MRQGLDDLKAAGCQKVATCPSSLVNPSQPLSSFQILVVPEYPQYSSTTSASIYDELFAQLRQYRNVPTIRIATPYYDHPAYIASLAAVTKTYLADKPTVEKHIISFHGIPERYHLQGDPYPWHCEQTALALAEAMGWRDSEWVLTYQSVFGKDPWLRPATDDTVASLAKQGRGSSFHLIKLSPHLGLGLKRVSIVCPGFLTDCLETVDENGTENADVFKEHGGEEVVLVPCLNDEPVGVVP
jgi:ferrochelatase